jgi:hypothetical protein
MQRRKKKTQICVTGPQCINLYLPIYVHDLLSSAVQQKGTVPAGIHAIAMSTRAPSQYILLETCDIVQRFFAQQETGSALLKKTYNNMPKNTFVTNVAIL